MRNGRPSAHRKHLTSLRNVRRASGRHDCPLCRFGGAKMWRKKDLPDGRQVQRIFIPKGFDWVKTISPMLSKAGEGPVMWCPAVHKSDLHAIDATSARRRVLDRATWTARLRCRQHPTE